MLVFLFEKNMILFLLPIICEKNINIIHIQRNKLTCTLRCFKNCIPNKLNSFNFYGSSI